MNRKLLNFILSGALLFSCVCFFSSCKDTSEDLFAEVKGEQTTLQAQLAAAQATIDKLNAELESLKSKVNSMNSCDCDLSAIQAQIAAMQNTLNANTGDIANLAAQLAQAEANILAVQTQLNELLNGDLKKLLELADVENLEKVLNEYQVKTLPEALEQLIKDVAALQGQKIPEDLTERVEGLETTVGELQEALGLKASTEDLQAAIAEINAAIDEKAAQLQEVLEGVIAQVAANAAGVATLNTTVGELKTQLTEGLADVQEQINSINETLDTLAPLQDLKNLEDRINHIINSIVLQQVTNKVFGSLSLPLGIQTNVLMAYHGHNDSEITEFPSYRTSVEYNSVATFNYSELTGVATFKVPANVLIDESANNAGNIYFTINPTNVNLQGSVFSLVNSQDEGCGIELGQPVASDKLLMFGWSRSEANGFYCANAYLPESNIDKCNITLGGELKSELKDAAKNFLHDLKNRERPDLSQIATVIKDLLQRMNGWLPALAVKGEYQYKDAEGNVVKAATISNYGIAAAALEPLSFRFLDGQENKFDKVPEIPTLNDFEFEIGEVKLELSSDFKINNIDVTISFDKLVLSDDDLTIDANVIIDGVPYPVEGKIEGLEDNVVVKINDKLEEIVGAVDDEVTKQVNDMVAQINKQVDDMLNDMSTQVNDQLNDLLSDLSDDVNGEFDKYVGRINRLINLANRLIARVNRVLANPNHYLQPLAIYNGSDGELHLLSTSAAKPSRFYMNGGNATTLYFTSYTLETIAPSYKKFVKVVNAWKNGDASRTPVASAIDNANAKGSLNQVINGDQIRFAFAPEAGYTYEVVLQALDYQGYTSTRRCFIEVR